MSQQLVLFLLVLISVFISLIDIKFHRIPNFSILVLAALLFAEINASTPILIVVSIFTLWSIGTIFKVGMGDLKLLTILVILQGQILLSPYMLVLFSLVSALSILIHLVIKRSFVGEIALAPAILIPFTFLYFAFYAD